MTAVETLKTALTNVVLLKRSLEICESLRVNNKRPRSRLLLRLGRARSRNILKLQKIAFNWEYKVKTEEIHRVYKRKKLSNPFEGKAQALKITCSDLRWKKMTADSKTRGPNGKFLSGAVGSSKNFQGIWWDNCSSDEVVNFWKSPRGKVEFSDLPAPLCDRQRNRCTLARGRAVETSKIPNQLFPKILTSEVFRELS